MVNLEQFIAKYVTERQESLFQRDVEKCKENLWQKISGKSVLVIGGAGSIGSSFVKTILPYEPATLVIVDTNENALAELTRDLRSTKDMYMPKDYVTYPMDYASKVFEKMFRSRKGFHIVANFSAHKHVRSEKDVYSIEALLSNNVFCANRLLELLAEYPPEEYFCVSTDKAANPVNIMGASKRIMEDLIFAYSNEFPVKTARFANVAFSNGSLLDGFLNRIRKLQPLSAPIDVKRYFVSPAESGQICMMSCVLGSNREIFFPKLKESQMMTFDKIAEKLLLEEGYEIIRCQSDEEAVVLAEELGKGSIAYPVYFSISDTSGEKAYEEFFTKDENVDLERFASMGVITGKKMTDRDAVLQVLAELKRAFSDEMVAKEEIVAILKSYLPNFEHIETGKSLDSKM